MLGGEVVGGEEKCAILFAVSEGRSKADKQLHGGPYCRPVLRWISSRVVNEACAPIRLQTSISLSVK